MAESIKSGSSRVTYLLHFEGYLYYKNEGVSDKKAYGKCGRVHQSAKQVL